MNTFRKFNKNAKALSPVVASIILIAVTVAVSVVVAAWMGGMTVGLMGNAEQISLVNVEFEAAGQNATITVQNSGGGDASITAAYIDGSAATAGTTALPVTVPKSDTALVDLAAPTGDFVAGQAYQFKLITSKGTSAVYTATYNPPA